MAYKKPAASTDTPLGRKLDVAEVIATSGVNTAKKATKKSAKKASKKASKKAAKKEVKKEGRSTPRSLMGDSGADLVAKSRDMLRAASAARANKPSNFKTMAEVRREMLTLPHIALQWALGSHGIPHGSLVEIIAPDGVGKTHLVYYLLGNAILSGCPSLYMEAEGKPMLGDRALRLFHTDPSMAQRVADRLCWVGVHSLSEMDEKLHDFVKLWRGKLDWPLNSPLVVAVDPWSKLLNQGEAIGFYNYGKNMVGKPDKGKPGKAKFKETGTVSNLGHAQFASDWARRLATTMDTQNVIVILVHHQQDKIEMSAGPKMPGFMESPLTAMLKNRTHRGGRSLNQTAAVQLIMAPLSDVKNDATEAFEGSNVRIRVEKNSYGPRNRQIDFFLRNEHMAYDRPGYIDPAVQFDGHFARWLAQQGMFGIKVDSNLYTCQEMGILAVSAAAMGNAVNTNEAARMRVGGLTGIAGYDSAVDEVQKAIYGQKTTVIPKSPSTDADDGDDDETAGDSGDESLGLSAGSEDS